MQGYASGGKDIKLGFVGAGGINFGTPEGVWNHAARLNEFPGQCLLLVYHIQYVIIEDQADSSQTYSRGLCSVADLTFSAIIEPNTALAEQRLKENREGPHGHKWANCQLFKSHRDMLKAQVSHNSDEGIMGSPLAVFPNSSHIWRHTKISGSHCSHACRPSAQKCRLHCSPAEVWQMTS